MYSGPMSFKGGDFIVQLILVIYCAILGGAFTFEALRHFTRRGKG